MKNLLKNNRQSLYNVGRFAPFLCVAITFTVNMACRNNHLDDISENKSNNDYIYKKAETEQEKALLGGALLYSEFESETLDWAEVVDSSNVDPQMKSALDVVKMMHVDRIKKSFKLFENGSFYMTIEKINPKNFKNPTIIYKGPKNDPTESFKWTIDNSKITAYRKDGTVVEIPNNLPLMKAMADALKKECDNNKAHMLSLHTITLNGNAASINSDCVKQSIEKEDGSSISTTPGGLKLYKRRLTSLISTINKTTHHISNKESYNSLNKKQLFLLLKNKYEQRKQQNLFLKTSNQINDDNNQLADGELKKMFEEDIKTILENKSKIDYIGAKQVVVVDTVKNKIMGTYVESADGDAISITSRYEYKAENENNIVKMHNQEFYVDVVTGANILYSSNSSYENVTVLTKH